MMHLRTLLLAQVVAFSLAFAGGIAWERETPLVQAQTIVPAGYRLVEVARLPSCDATRHVLNFQAMARGTHVALAIPEVQARYAPHPLVGDAAWHRWAVDEYDASLDVLHAFEWATKVCEGGN